MNECTDRGMPTALLRVDTKVWNGAETLVFSSGKGSKILENQRIMRWNSIPLKFMFTWDLRV